MTEESFRLPPSTRPAYYAIHLALNLENWSFIGREEIQLQLHQPSSTLELHALELSISDAVVLANGQQLGLKTTFHPERETVSLAADRPIPAGHATLRLSFAGAIGQELIGLYRAQVGERRYAFSQCEPTYARRIFPCFDEPAFKARFSLSVEAPQGLQVVSNEPVASEGPGAAPGTRLVSFETTPRMSTYLFALAVGQLEEGPRGQISSGVPVRVWAAPGKAHLGRFAAEAAVASLERLERYFGIPYPYRKLDLLAVPDFEAGAMENSGAVFFRERRLLCDVDQTPLETLKSIALVVAHELAHQWFGNLVTMQWWDDLWLNEAFASWMEHVIVDEWRPEWKVWVDFQQTKAEPFYKDALVSTRAIHAPVESAEQASEMFDAITYEKGAAVLRMIESYLSPTTFRDGVRHYLHQHLEGNATATDLFEALGVASAQPISQVAEDWIEQPGYPLISTRLLGQAEGRAQLELRQQRFFLDPAASAQRATHERWRLPIVLRYQVQGAVHEQRLLLEEQQRQLTLDQPASPAWLVANAGENGFYRVAYEDALVHKLVGHLDQALGPAERVGFLGNQWALVRAGHASAAAFLDLLGPFQAEKARAVVESIVDRLAFYRQFLVDPAHRPAFARLVETLFRSALQDLDWSPQAEEDDETRLRRAVVIRALGRVARAGDVVAEARRLLERHWAQPESVDPNLLDVLVAIAAQDGNAALFDTYLERAQRAPTPDEQFRHLLGLGAFEEPALVERALQLTLTPTIQTQDVGLLLQRLLANGAATEATWRFMQQHWEPLHRRLPPLMVRRVIHGLVGLGTHEARRQVEDFFKRHPVEVAERTLRQTLEELDLLASFRERAMPDIRAYLEALAGR